MTISLVKHGTKHLQKFETGCNKCDSVLHYMKDDVKFDSVLCRKTIKCPVCETEIKVYFNKLVDEKPKVIS